MTLIVADIFDENQMSFASDTLVTWDPGARAAAPGTEEFAKLVIVRDNLVVAIAGHDVHGRVRDIISMRNESLRGIVAALEEDPTTAFLVASLEPFELWKIEPGLAVEVTSAGRSWVGDEVAYADNYEPPYASQFLDQPVPFRQMTAMQAVIMQQSAKTVGGRALRVQSARGQFRFLPDAEFVLGGGGSSVVTGYGATPGAVGIYYDAHRVGGLFCQSDPGLKRRQAEARGLGALSKVPSLSSEARAGHEVAMPRCVATGLPHWIRLRDGRD